MPVVRTAGIGSILGQRPTREGCYAVAGGPSDSVAKKLRYLAGQLSDPLAKQVADVLLDAEEHATPQAEALAEHLKAASRS